MKAIVPLLALTALLGSCAAPPKPAPQPPAPVAASPLPPVAAPAPLPPPPADWRDAAQTPGTWRWNQVDGTSAASFGVSRTDPVVMLACDRPSKRVMLRRAAPDAPVSATAMRVLTTSLNRPIASDPALSTGGWLVVPLAVNDPLLDAMAFSRGRFALEAAGQPTLYLPSWPELSRVVQDCRP